MTGTKTVAERLREKHANLTERDCWAFPEAVGKKCRDFKDCQTCVEYVLNALADMIEAEKAELDKRIEVLESDRDDYIEHITTFASWQMQIANMLDIPLAERNDSGEVQAKIIATLKERTKTEQNGVDVDALLKLEDTFCHWAEMAAENNDACQKISVGTLLDTAKRIRNAVKGAKPQLPEGIDLDALRYCADYLDKIDHPTIADTIRAAIEGETGELFKRPEPEVLDVDNVPIHVGDTVWNINNGKKYEVLKLPHKGSYQSVMVRGEDGTDGFDPDRLTHRKPDTQEAIDADCWVDAKEYCEKYGVKTEWPKHYGKAKCEHLLERQRKLLGGE